MSGEAQIGLDFNESSPAKPTEDGWHSDPEPSQQESGSEDNGSQSGDNANNNDDSGSSDDNIIWPRVTKRRRLSRSRSKAAEHVAPKQPGAKRPDYMSPTQIAKIFKQDISPKTLCELSAMKDCSPSAVLKVMPKASVSQICQMVEL